MNIANLLELKARVEELPQTEINWLLLECMKTGKVNVSMLFEEYIEYQHQKQKGQNILINKMGMWLATFWDEHKTAKPFLKSASAYALLKSKAMKGAKIEKRLKKQLEQAPYREDEYGFPITNIK